MTLEKGSPGIFVELQGLGLQRIKRKTQQQVFLSFVNSILVVLSQTLRKSLENKLTEVYISANV